MLKFKVASFEEEAGFIFELGYSLVDEDRIKVRTDKCIFLNISKDLKKEILSSKTLNKRIIKKIVSEEKKQTSNSLEKQIKVKKEKLEKSWRKIEKKYFSFMKQLTGIEIKDIVCYINRFCVGSYYYPKTIVIDHNSIAPEYVIAEEIFHLYYWKIWGSIFKKNYADPKLDPYELKGKKWSAWHISEVMPEFFLLNFFFGKIDRTESYPWLDEIKKDIGKIEFTDFKDFIIKVHKKLLPEL